MANLELNFFVNFITDVIKALFNKNNFVNIIQLREYDKVLLKLNWIKVLKKLYHEILVLNIRP
jgi:hypothetical protein